MDTDIECRSKRAHALVRHAVAAEIEDLNAAIGSHHAGQQDHALIAEAAHAELEVSDRGGDLSTQRVVGEAQQTQ